MESSALCKSPLHRGRRNAQPLRCSLASLPLSLALPVFHSSSSSSVAHSISIKPAPPVRLLLDIPEVKHLQPRVASTTKLLYLSLSPFATSPYYHRPPYHSFPACLQLDCIRILPPLAHVSFQTRTTKSYNRHKEPFTGSPLLSNVGNFVNDCCNQPFYHSHLNHHACHQKRPSS